MAQGRPTIAVSVVRVLVDGAASEGVPRAALLEGLGLTDSALAAPDGRVEVHRLLDAWAFVMRELRDPAVPIRLGARVTLADYAVFGFATMTGGTGREVLARAARLHALLTDSAKLDVHEEGAHATVRWTRRGPLTLGHRVANEFALAGVVRAASQILRREVKPHQVSFRHEAPTDTRAHEAFFGCDLRWSGEHDEVVLARALLDEVPALSDDALSSYLLDHAEAKLRDLGVDGTWRSRVERAVLRRLPEGTATVTQVARDLGTSERTLRRALTTEATSYEAVLRETREARARVLLERTEHTLLAIALELGFADAAAFSHAFKRWTGDSPRDLRRRRRSSG